MILDNELASSSRASHSGRRCGNTCTVHERIVCIQYRKSRKRMIVEIKVQSESLW